MNCKNKGPASYFIKTDIAFPDMFFVKEGTRDEPLPEANWQYFVALTERLRVCVRRCGRPILIYGKNYCQFPLKSNKYYRI